MPQVGGVEEKEEEEEEEEKEKKMAYTAKDLRPPTAFSVPKRNKSEV